MLWKGRGDVVRAAAMGADQHRGVVVLGAALLDLAADELDGLGGGGRLEEPRELIEAYRLVDAVRDEEPGPAGSDGEPGGVRLAAAADGALQAVGAGRVRDLVQRDLPGFPLGEGRGVVPRLEADGAVGGAGED